MFSVCVCVVYPPSLSVGAANACLCVHTIITQWLVSPPPHTPNEKHQLTRIRGNCMGFAYAFNHVIIVATQTYTNELPIIIIIIILAIASYIT